MKPLVLVVRAPGTNCDFETAHAFEMAGARAERLHINALLEDPDQVDRFDIVCFPGGFSYGDDLSAGQILAFQVEKKLVEKLKCFPSQGKLILGICNGFQVLIKTGLLISAGKEGFPATLTWNASGRYIDRWVKLVPGESKCVFLRGVQELYLPIAHGEGRFVTENESTKQVMQDAGQYALNYFQNGSNDNPNGSVDNVAGLCDPTGHIFGLMPHPERHVFATQHPRWTREGLKEKPDGRWIFENAVAHFNA